ncbi:MAG: zinc ribbon domain-containing protein [Ruminococcus sp.]|nr:zinc ribbon domain-containing protein [Ruminococcus sp.]MDE6101995.1 zinc ribbon domain-containing protein [Ruminococcus sp.]MDE6664961.1 zinc ribbon domain-containing protein [Ruminococcus sp.]
MGIIDKFNDAQRAVAEKSKSVSEANNLKRKILYEEERIVEIFADIGKMYYKNPNDDPAEFKVLCDDIDTRRRRIKRMRNELNGIRGYKVCPKCDAEVNDRFQFCGRCGARLPEVEENDFIIEPNDFNKEQQ